MTNQIADWIEEQNRYMSSRSRNTRGIVATKAILRCAEPIEPSDSVSNLTRPPRCWARRATTRNRVLLRSTNKGGKNTPKPQAASRRKSMLRITSQSRVDNNEEPIINSVMPSPPPSPLPEGPVTRSKTKSREIKIMQSNVQSGGERTGGQVSISLGPGGHDVQPVGERVKSERSGV